MPIEQVVAWCLISFALGIAVFLIGYEIREARCRAKWIATGGRPVITHRIDADTAVYAGSEADAERMKAFILSTVRDARNRFIIR